MLKFKSNNLQIKIFCLFCCIALLVSSASISSLADDAAPDNATSAQALGLEVVAENKHFALEANLSTGKFGLVNKENNQVWYNTPIDTENDTLTVGTTYTNVQSSIVVGYVERANEPGSNELNFANDFVYCPPEQLKITKIKNGIKIIYDFADFGFSIPVEYTLFKDYFEAKIDTEAIKEGKEYYIVDINLLPVFGAGNWAEKGQLLIPDGSGAAINFNNGVYSTTTYISKIYGEDCAIPKEILRNKVVPTYMPVFATIKQSGSLLGIIDDGDADASITYINGNERCGYNAVSGIFNYRTKDSSVIFSGTGSSNNINRVSRAHSKAESFCVKYYATAKTDYPQLAKIYRNYLIKEKDMIKSVSPVSFNIDIYGATETKSSFLGIPYNKKIALTDYSQAKKILTDLKKEGIEKVSARYIGWNNNGILNKKINTSANATNFMGGKKKLLSLIDYCESNQVSLYLDNDIVSFRKNGNGVKKSRDAVNTVFSEPSLQTSYMLSVYAPVLSQDNVYLLDSSKTEVVFDRYFKSLKKNYPSLKTIGLYTTGNKLYSNFEPTNAKLRTELLEKYISIYEKAYKEDYKLVFNAANAYTFPYAQTLLSVPSASSGYNAFNIDIPFYSMVLHGYKNMATSPILQSSSPKISFLKAVELGIGITYSGIYEDSSTLTHTMYHNLYSSCYKLWIDTAAEQYKQYNELYERIYNLEITAYKQITKDVVLTEYDNNIAVYVNYGDSTVSVDGITIQANNFAVKELL